jgi:hypothetical protein
MNQEALVSERDAMIAQIKKYVPIVVPLFSIEGSLRQYSEQLHNFTTTPTHLERQKVVREIIHQHAKRIFGKEYEELNLQLDDQLMLNIIDHHQVFNTPATLASNIMGNSNKLLQKEKPSAIVVLSSSDIPLDNAFTKGGFRLHDKQVALFSAKDFEMNSHMAPKQPFDFIRRLKDNKRWDSFSEEEQAFLTTYQELFDSLDFSGAQNYSDQISIILKHTWPLLFEESLRPTLPEIAFIPHEEVVADCLIHILNQKNIISECLFNPSFRDSMIRDCSGIAGCWDEARNKGTHFFWHRHPTKAKMVRMYIKDGFLVPQRDDMADIKIPLNAETIIDLLKRRVIYPNVFLIYSTLHFYAGIKPLTGYASMVCITNLKGKWMHNLQNTTLAEEIKLIENVSTNTGFVGGLPFFFKRMNGSVKTLYAADLMFEGGATKEYLTDLFELPYQDFLSVGIPDMYPYYSQEYIPASEKITTTLGFDQMAEFVFGKLDSL